MSEISNLGYVALGVSDLGRWAHFANDILGLQTAAHIPGEMLTLRMDEHAQRMVLLQGDDDDVRSLGWQFDDAQALKSFVEHVQAKGVAVEAGTPELARARKVEQLFHCADPTGYRHEFYVGPATSGANDPFRSPSLKGKGFRTGDLGLGHVLMRASNYPESVDFYQRVLKLKVSDYIREEIAPGMVVDATFMHTKTGRHHSLATAVMPTKKMLSHLMVEVQDIDDVGLAYDRCLRAGLEIRLSLGHHPNDQMFSFYVASPSGFAVEVGWGGTVIDESNWRVVSYSKLSDWGHQRVAPR